jgi:hypothetical protein
LKEKIEPSDAEKLLKIYEYFGPTVTSKVFLWSLGGDVEEAMKIGKLIRHLRLDVFVPDRPNTLRVLGQFSVQASPIDKGNDVCASACVLAYAGGITRQGDLLVLHRPFLVPKDTSKIFDVDFENSEKAIINTTVIICGKWNSRTTISKKRSPPLHKTDTFLFIRN